MPHDLIDRMDMLRRSDAAFSAIETDIVAEKASSLGHHGRLVETAMAALRAHDAVPGGDPEARLKLVKAAAHQVWAFLVQRELCGLRDQKQIIKDYGIPGEVIVRLGAIER